MLCIWATLQWWLLSRKYEILPRQKLAASDAYLNLSLVGRCSAWLTPWVVWGMSEKIGFIIGFIILYPQMTLGYSHGEWLHGSVWLGYIKLYPQMTVGDNESSWWLTHGSQGKCLHFHTIDSPCLCLEVLRNRVLVWVSQFIAIPR